ncbi:Beta-(1--_2)glucan export ATP-binding/permease protein like [Melia azedarach]|uniref:Beta-(1-->2)glucan export ATP-binding/permease protein like n=1 Tax=Melia azedarach TaxID=155640 RepID=A0ACC1Z1I5_MELAZ|nr:Beta-(1-->2)glucan export ATP-binding/permease protein like [Melia azedarach]
MDALVRNTTVNFSRRFTDYELLGQGSEVGTEDYNNQWRRNFSRRRKEPHTMKSFSYRRKRARQRQIFLNSYKLASLENLGQSKPSQRLKKAVVKVKTAVVAVVAFMRTGSCRSCNSRTAIDATSPTTIRKFF